MKLVLRVLSLLLPLLCSAVASAAPEPPPATVMQALGRGVNVSIWYTYRGQAGIDPARWYPDAADWRLMRALGMRHVRVQFDPAYFREGADSPGLNRERMRELQRDLAPAWAAGLLVVLAAEPAAAEKTRMLKDETGIAELAGFWGAFATALKGVRPDRLVFEALNEPTNTDATGNRLLMQKLAGAIRVAAPLHSIVVEGHGYSGIAELIAFEPLSLPNLIYSFHFYEPHNFTHQGAFWAWPMFLKFKDLPYPTSPELMAPLVEKADDELKPYLVEYGAQAWNRARIEAELDKAKSWAEAKGVPVWCGEFGVTRLGPPLDARRTWLMDVRSALEARGMGWSVFDYAGHLGLVTGNAGARQLDPLDAQALGLQPPVVPAGQ